MITAYWDVATQSLQYLETKEATPQFMRTLKGKSLIMQNAPFDCAMIHNNYGVDLMPDVHTDTLVLGHLLNENRHNGLKERGVELYGEDARAEQVAMKESVHKNGGLMTKDCYELYKGDADLIAMYGAKDAILTMKVFLNDVPILFEQGLDKFFYEDESMPLLRGPTYDMNTQGLRVDGDKLQALKGTLEAECHEAKAFVYKEIDAHIKDKYKGTSKANTFNIGANQQLAWLLFEHLGNEFGTLTESGKDLCRGLDIQVPYTAVAKRSFISYCKSLKGQLVTPVDVKGQRKKPTKVRDPWQYMAAGAEVLKKPSERYLWVARLLEYKKNLKLLNTYVEGIQSRMKYNVIRPNFLQHGTTSGRYACIAEGQMITMPGGDRPIEQVKPGDIVYCYTEDGRPTASKVKAVYDNGLQDCVELKWRSQGSHKEGSLICTADHRIKTRDNAWVAAQELEINARVYHLRRAKSPVSDRLRIYGAEYFMKNEEQLLKESFLGSDSTMHAHHLNEIKSDNRVENLEILPATLHVSRHSSESMSKRGDKGWQHLLLPENRPAPMRGSGHPMWIGVTRFGLLRNLARAGGRATRVEMDFATLKQKAETLGLNLGAIGDRYNSRGQYLSRGFILRALQGNTQRQAIAAAGVSFYKLKTLCRDHGLESNHKIVSRTPVGVHRVYDLEVEEHHNFIASEICVHNCRNPNFQNLPRDDKRIKACIISRPGKVFVGADFAQLEPRVFASFSKDERLLKCFKDGDDFYSVVGAPIFGKYDCTLKKDDSPDSFPVKYKKLRDAAKVIALATPYGTMAPQMSSEMASKAKQAKSVQECQAIIDDYFAAYPSVHKLMLDSHTQAKTHGVVYNLFGRPRRIPAAMDLPRLYGKNTPHGELPRAARNLLNLSMNHPIQSTGASIMNRAAIAAWNSFRALAIDDPRWLEVKIVLQVHDELIIEGPEALADDMVIVLQDAMQHTVVLPGVDLIAEPKIARNLADLK